MNNKLNALIETFGNENFKGMVSFIATTSFKANKKSRITGNATPKAVTGAKKYAYHTVNMGHVYQDLVNLRKNKEGQEKNFEAKSTYAHPITDNGMILKHDTKDTHYLRVYRNVSKPFNSRTLVVDGEGTVMSLNEFLNTYKEYLSTSYFNKKNESQGLKEENQIIVNNYNVENVEYVRRGDVEFSEIKLDTWNRLFVEFNKEELSA